VRGKPVLSERPGPHRFARRHACRTADRVLSACPASGSDSPHLL